MLTIRMLSSLLEQIDLYTTCQGERFVRRSLMWSLIPKIGEGFVFMTFYDQLAKKTLLQWSVVKNILTSGISQWLPECIRYTAPENYSLCTLRIVFNHFKRVGTKRDRLVSVEHENVV